MPKNRAILLLAAIAVVGMVFSARHAAMMADSHADEMAGSCLMICLTQGDAHADLPVVQVWPQLGILILAFSIIAAASAAFLAFEPISFLRRDRHRYLIRNRSLRW
jgi:hypothetical protein